MDRFRKDDPQRPRIIDRQCPVVGAGKVQRDRGRVCRGATTIGPRPHLLDIHAHPGHLLVTAWVSAPHLHVLAGRLPVSDLARSSRPRPTRPISGHSNSSTCVLFVPFGIADGGN
uniref:Uncharacterized protein n=1 Tax=Nocardia sp. C-14-1 TaxID=312532 RepID=Q2VHX9_9NOCA|nr:hypothetical protein pC1.4 [Nocardia sp. C-14-1]